MTTSKRKQSFTEATLLEALKNAKPGQQLDFNGVPKKAMESAVSKLSMPSKRMASLANDLDLGPHVKQISYWWGVRVEVDHEGMLALAEGGGATVALLTALGVTAIAAVVIAGVIGIWSAFDRGNGVIFFVTWAGVHWFTPRQWCPI